MKQCPKIYEALQEDKAKLICDSFIQVSYNLSKFLGTENALGAPVKVSQIIQAQPQGKFRHVCCISYFVIFHGDLNKIVELVK